MNRERELLEMLFELTDKLEDHYYYILNGNYSNTMPEKEYEQLRNLLCIVEDYLNK